VDFSLKHPTHRLRHALDAQSVSLEQVLPASYVMVEGVRKTEHRERPRPHLLRGKCLEDGASESSSDPVLFDRHDRAGVEGGGNYCTAIERLKRVHAYDAKVCAFAAKELGSRES